MKILTCLNFRLSGFTPALVSPVVPSLHRTRPAGQEVLHVQRHGLGEVGHAPKAATGGTVVQQPAHSSGWVPFQDVLLCSEVLLILVEHVVGDVDDLLHVDDGADARDVHVGQHGEHQDGLHQQLSVLRLRDAVQNRLNVDGEFDLSWCHLPGG